MGTPRKRTPSSPGPVRAGSWMALLAATTLGVEGASTLRAEVVADGELRDAGEYRLIVQSYDAAEGASLPTERARPVGSLQRAVTADELRKGVHVQLLELRGAAAPANGAEPLVVAWIEDGKPDLEFDGRTARPRPDGVVGVVRGSGRHGPVRVRLSAGKKKLAA